MNKEKIKDEIKQAVSQIDGAQEGAYIKAQALVTDIIAKNVKLTATNKHEKQQIAKLVRELFAFSDTLTYDFNLLKIEG